jgi:hypothetical protein
VSSRSPFCTGCDTAADAGSVKDFCAAVALSLIAVFGECTVMDGEREPKGESAMIRVEGKGQTLGSDKNFFFFKTNNSHRYSVATKSIKRSYLAKYLSR